MNDIQFYILIALIVVIILGLGVYFLYRHIKNNRFKTFRDSKKNKVSSICKKFVLMNFFKHTGNYSFTSKGKTYHIDNIISCPMGYILINAICLRGEIYCKTENQKWLHYTGDVKESIPDLLEELNCSIMALRDNFSKDKIYKCKFFPAVVFIDKKAELFISDKKLPIFKSGKLKSFLTSPEFMDKGNNDPKLLASQLEKYRLN